MNDLYIYSAIAVMAFGTFLTRALPFVIFSGSRKTPKIIEKLSKVLPAAVMGMLVVYCLKGVNFVAAANWAPAAIASAVVIALHVWKRNTLLSILCGTVCHMLLVQLVF